jgi:hypothetical protein
VLDLAEVPLAQAEQDRTVELRVAADEVLLVGLEGAAVLVVPELAGKVAVVDKDLTAIPVLWLARQVAATLQQQDPLARRRQLVRQRATAGAGTNDDDVVVLGGHRAHS